MIGIHAVRTQFNVCDTALIIILLEKEEKEETQEKVNNCEFYTTLFCTLHHYCTCTTCRINSSHEQPPRMLEIGHVVRSCDLCKFKSKMLTTTTTTTVIIDLIEKVLLDLKNLGDPSQRKLMPELQQVVVLLINFFIGTWKARDTTIHTIPSSVPNHC